MKVLLLPLFGSWAHLHFLAGTQIRKKVSESVHTLHPRGWHPLLHTIISAPAVKVDHWKFLPMLFGEAASAWCGLWYNQVTHCHGLPLMWSGSPVRCYIVTDGVPVNQPFHQLPNSGAGWGSVDRKCKLRLEELSLTVGMNQILSPKASYVVSLPPSGNLVFLRDAPYCRLSIGTCCWKTGHSEAVTARLWEIHALGPIRGCHLCFNGPSIYAPVMPILATSTNQVLLCICLFRANLPLPW